MRLTHVIFAVALSAVAVAGCGGESGAGEPVVTRPVSGPGFTFSAPAGRELSRTPRSVSVLPAEDGAPELVSVTVFPLVKPYRPALWTQAAEELDGVAERLAKSLGGELEKEPETVRRGGLRGRLYEIDYEREGVELRQRLTLLLSRRTEYQLLCRWEAGGDAPEACMGLETSFKVSR
jgi:predicted small secreted protein